MSIDKITGVALVKTSRQNISNLLKILDSRINPEWQHLKIKFCSFYF